MKLFTYYSNIPDMSAADELRNLVLWRQYHAALGFEPFALNEWHARQHPYFEEFNSAVSKLPTINPKFYDLACFLRWLAMAQVAGGYGVLMDYDCYLLATVGDDLGPVTRPTGQEQNQLRVYQGYVPCLVAGSAQQFLYQCRRFAAYAPRDGENHVSDMTILEKQAIQDDAHPECAASFVRLNYVKSYGEDMWKSAPAVHFSNQSTVPAGKSPRWKHLPILLKEHT